MIEREKNETPDPFNNKSNIDQKLMKSQTSIYGPSWICSINKKSMKENSDKFILKIIISYIWNF